MADGPAKIDERAVAEKQRDMSIETLNHPRDRCMKFPDEAAHILGIELCCNLRRSHEIDECHCKVAPLRSGWNCTPSTLPRSTAETNGRP